MKKEDFSSILFFLGFLGLIISVTIQDIEILHHGRINPLYIFIHIIFIIMVLVGEGYKIKK